MSTAILLALSTILSFAITALSGKVLIPFLKKLKYGQTILDIGPKWHKAKEGTPTMGGLMFILGIVVSILTVGATAMLIIKNPSVSQRLELLRISAGVIMALLFAAVGFIDDYIKVVKKRNLGLTAKQKMLLMIFVAAMYLLTLYISGDRGVTDIPFIGQVEINTWVYYIIALIAIVGFVNAVNLTDGIDGLATSVTFFATVTFMLIASLRGIFGLSILAASVAGGCIGFLVWNFYPAKVFMGDTGSLFLGGMFCALAFGVNMPILIIPVGIIYLCEAGSVMLQVSYFKLTKGKRIFKMAPIHHHFELCGWSETRVVAVFSIVTALLCLVALMAM